MMKFSYDAFNRPERPYTYLAKPNKDYIGTIQSSELSGDACFNNISQFTFKVNKYEDGEPTLHYDEIENDLLVEISYIGWFQITNTSTVGDGNNEYIEVTLSSLENEATTKTLTSFGQLGVSTDEQGGLDRYKLYDISDVEHSILHIWMKKLPSWSIGYIDPAITTEYRTFTNDEVGAYSFLVNDCSSTFECIFQFDTFNQTVSAYKLENIGKKTSIYLSYDNLVKKITSVSAASDIITVYTVAGGDDNGSTLGIIEVNPSGTNQIYNFSYYKKNMSETLRNKLTAYEIESASRSVNFTSAIELQKTYYDDLNTLQNKLPSTSTSTNWTEYGLVELNSKYKIYNNNMSLYIGKTDSTSITNYNNNYALREAVGAEIKVRENQISAKETQIINQQAYCDSLTLNLEEYLGTELFKDLSRFYHEATFTDDSFVVTSLMTPSEALQMKRDLLSLAQSDLAKKCKPSYTMEVDAINFTVIPEFKKFSDQLELGNIITLDLGNGTLVESRLLKLHLDWDNPDNFTMTFSSKNRLDGIYELAEIQSEANSAATSQAISGTGWNQIKNKTSTIDNYMKSTFDLAKQKLTNGKDETFIADDTGTLWRRKNDATDGYSPNQMWGTSNGLFMTQDAWQNVALAIGEGLYNGQPLYGIWAKLLCGDLVLTKNLHIINNNSSIIMNEDGASFKNCGITIEKGNNVLTLNATDGIKLMNGTTQQFYIGVDGSLNLTSNITASNITSTTINNGNGTFSVDVAGNLICTSADIKGKITATSGNIAGFTIDTTQMTAGTGNKFVRISPYSTTPGTNNYSTDYGAIDLGRTSDGLDTLIHLRSDGYARFGLADKNGSVRFNHTVTEDGIQYTYPMYTKQFKIAENGMVYCDWIQSKTDMNIWSETSLAIGSGSGRFSIAGADICLEDGRPINMSMKKFTYNGYDILHMGNISTNKITPNLTESNNIDFAGGINAASVTYVQTYFARSSEVSTLSSNLNALASYVSELSSRVSTLENKTT